VHSIITAPVSLWSLEKTRHSAQLYKSNLSGYTCSAILIVYIPNKTVGEMYKNRITLRIKSNMSSHCLTGCACAEYVLQGGTYFDNYRSPQGRFYKVSLPKVTLEFRMLTATGVMSLICSIAVLPLTLVTAPRTSLYTLTLVLMPMVTSAL